jgi:RNA-splicing ligase RtcB
MMVAMAMPAFAAQPEGPVGGICIFYDENGQVIPGGVGFHCVGNAFTLEYDCHGTQFTPSIS